MNITGFTFSNTRKRLLAPFLNLIIIFILSFLLDYWLSPFTYKKWTNYEAKSSEYSQIVEKYEAEQDRYGIASYDENGKRYYVDNISQEIIDEFRSDPVVNELILKEKNLEKKLVFITVSSNMISFLLTSLLLSILFAIIFGKYLSLGYALFQQKVVTEDGSVPKTSKRLIYAITRWLLLIPLGICTLFIIPIVSIYHVIYDDYHRTKLEKAFNLFCVTGVEI